MLHCLFSVEAHSSFTVHFPGICNDLADKNWLTSSWGKWKGLPPSIISSSLLSYGGCSIETWAGRLPLGLNWLSHTGWNHCVVYQAPQPHDPDASEVMSIVLLFIGMMRAMPFQYVVFHHITSQQNFLFRWTLLHNTEEWNGFSREGLALWNHPAGML